MTLRLLRAARRELMRAAAWYDDRAPGLGDRLLDDAGVTLRKVHEAPTQRPLLPGGIRRWSFETFPYAVIYAARPNEVLVIAIAHNKRRPGYWRRRVR